ncbi:MAG: aminoglycoside phosphotransferase family protein [Burkholderiaceae bacterium]
MTDQATCPALALDHPLRLFLGAEPALLLRWPSQRSRLPRKADAGSILVVVEAGDSPEVSLDQFLRHCCGALRSDGRIAVLLEGRAHRLFAGSLARLRARLRGQRGAGGHSAAGGARGAIPPTLRSVVAALRAGGCRSVAIHSAAPSLADPHEIRPRAWRAGWFAPAWLVTAGRGAPHAVPLLEAIVAAIDRSLTGGAPAARGSWHRVANSPRGKSVALATSGDTEVVIHLPRWPVAQADEAEAHRLLRDLQANPRIAARVPRPLSSGTIADQPFYAETRLEGIPLGAELSRNGSRSAQRAWLHEADAFLRALNPVLPQRAAAPLTAGAAGNDFRAMFDRMLAHIADRGLREATLALFEASLDGAASRIGLVHGDFATNNILVANGAISGVIDWEAARRAAPPVLDAFNYLDGVRRCCSPGLTIVETIPMLADGEWPVGEELDFLRSFFDYCGIDFRFRKGFALLYFLFHVGPQLRFAAHEPGPQRRMEQVLRQLLRRA